MVEQRYNVIEIYIYREIEKTLLLKNRTEDINYFLIYVSRKRRKDVHDYIEHLFRGKYILPMSSNDDEEVFRYAGYNILVKIKFNDYMKDDSYIIIYDN